MHLVLEYLPHLAVLTAIWKMPDFGRKVLAFLRDLHAYRDERKRAKND